MQVVKTYSETIAVEPRDEELPSDDAMMTSDTIDAVARVAKRLVAESRVRGLLPEGMRMSHDAMDGLDRVVRGLVEIAAVRCQANNRKTICKEDF